MHYSIITYYYSILIIIYSIIYYKILCIIYSCIMHYSIITYYSIVLINYNIYKIADCIIADT